MSTLINVGIVLLIVLVAALFVAAETALVSLREGQVKALSAQGRRGAAVARLSENPNRWLAAVQIGVTFTALLSSAFGAVTLADTASDGLRDVGLSDGAADALGVVGVTLVIGYVSLVVGELVPKRIALQRPERVARTFALVLDRIAGFARPLIWLLSVSTNAVVRLLGSDPSAGRDTITEEELRGLVAAHESLSKEERRLIDEVFAAGERQLREVLVPRTEVEFLDAATTITKALKDTKAASHSRYPVIHGNADDVRGFVHIRDLIGAGRGQTKVGDVVREVKMLPDTKRVLSALSEMRREGQHLAVVVDEYGGTAGIVTLEDLIVEVIGDIRDEYDPAETTARTLRGGDVEVDGLLNLDEFTEQTGVELPDGPYETVAGYVMSALGRVPKMGDAVEAPGVRLKVSGMDGRRIEKVRVTQLNGGADGA
ncbi:MAG TPA: hemolysin family protein [Frankiaceae bacterium]|nr:hemolysin family protein [Frankiaceae bacterium]